MGVGGEKPLQSLRDSFPTCCHVPLPRLRGIGVYADAGEAGEGVFPLRSALVPILITQPLFQLSVRPLGRQVSVFCENGSPRDAAKLRT